MHFNVLRNQECKFYCTVLNRLIQKHCSAKSGPVASRLILTPDNLFSRLTSGVLFEFLCYSFFKKQLNFGDADFDVDGLAKEPSDSVSPVRLSNLLDTLKRCKIVNLEFRAEDLLSSNHDAVLEFFWQVCRTHYLSFASVLKYPELLGFFGSSDAVELCSHGEQLLLTWMNRLLKDSGFSSKSVSNFSTDLTNSVALAAIVSRRNAATVPVVDKILGMDDKTLECKVSRAEALIGTLRDTQLDIGIEAIDVALGHPRLLLLFVANVFRCHMSSAKDLKESAQNDNAQFIRQNKVISELQSALSDLHRQHDIEVSRLKQDFEVYKDDLKAQFADTLQSTVSIEQNKLELLGSNFKKKESLAMNILVEQISLMRAVIDEKEDTGVKNAALLQKLRELSSESDIVAVLKLTTEMVRVTCRELKELAAHNTVMKQMLQNKEAIDNIVIEKMREFKFASLLKTSDK